MLKAKFCSFVVVLDASSSMCQQVEQIISILSMTAWARPGIVAYQWLGRFQQSAIVFAVFLFELSKILYQFLACSPPRLGY